LALLAIASIQFQSIKADTDIIQQLKIHTLAFAS
jgi:hypothetical protein